MIGIALDLPSQLLRQASAKFPLGIRKVSVFLGVWIYFNASKLVELGNETLVNENCQFISINLGTLMQVISTLSSNSVNHKSATR